MPGTIAFYAQNSPHLLCSECGAVKTETVTIFSRGKSMREYFGEILRLYPTSTVGDNDEDRPGFLLSYPDRDATNVRV